jgi:hypothetical protein
MVQHLVVVPAPYNEEYAQYRVHVIHGHAGMLLMVCQHSGSSLEHHGKGQRVCYFELQTTDTQSMPMVASTRQ